MAFSKASLQGLTTMDMLRPTKEMPLSPTSLAQPLRRGGLRPWAHKPLHYPMKDHKPSIRKPLWAARCPQRQQCVAPLPCGKNKTVIPPLLQMGTIKASDQIIV